MNAASYLHTDRRPRKVKNVWPEMKRAIEEKKALEARARYIDVMAQKDAMQVVMKLAAEVQALKARKPPSKKEQWRMNTARLALIREKREKSGLAIHKLIVRRILRLTGLTRTEILSHRREKEVVRARHCICYWTVRLTTLSLGQIGLLMERDHTSVYSAAKKWPLVRQVLHGRSLRRVK